MMGDAGRGADPRGSSETSPSPSRTAYSPTGSTDQPPSMVMV